MPKRKSIGKKLRFEIFKRDLFTCQYCGSTPPAVVLQVDHIIPVASGGENTETNLITACQGCNQGKGAVSLSESPETLAKKTELREEKREQLKAFELMLKLEKSRLTRNTNQLESYFAEQSNCGFSDSFKVSVKRFFERLPKQKVFDAMEIAVARGLDAEATLKYFCGVCWSMIKEKDHA